MQFPLATPAQKNRPAYFNEVSSQDYLGKIEQCNKQILHPTGQFLGELFDFCMRSDTASLHHDHILAMITFLEKSRNNVFIGISIPNLSIENCNSSNFYGNVFFRVGVLHNLLGNQFQTTYNMDQAVAVDNADACIWIGKCDTFQSKHD